ncbi:MAG: LLM class flavin-dependent oxidoreductase [Caldilineaceae bacterium]
MDWVGLEQARPLAAVRESVPAMRSLLRGERAALDGKWMQWTDEAYLRFDAPRVTPIYVEAMGPKMLHLAGQVADGVLPCSSRRSTTSTCVRWWQPAKRNRIRLCRRWTSPRASGFHCRKIETPPGVLAQKIAYYGPALGPLILSQLGVAQEEFAPIERAMVVERDEEKAISLVDERMLRIGVVGTPADVIARLEPLVTAGATHLSFGPPLGPDPVAAVRLLGDVVEHFNN